MKFYMKFILAGTQAFVLFIVIYFILRPKEPRSAKEESISESASDEEMCIPKSHVMYLKIHKCASSTIQNIFLRYGYKNNLSFALSPKGNYLGNPMKFKSHLLSDHLHPVDGVVDIFCLHTRFNYNELKKVLYPDTVWVTSVRDPVFMFESLFTFFGLSKLYQVELDDFASYRVEELIKIKPRHFGKFGKNQMLFDLGCDNDTSVVKLLKKLEEVDKIFDLVLISEKLEESLTLLRHKLCWSLEDVAFLAKNVRKDNAKLKMSHQTMQRIKELNSADQFLYNHFLMKHENMVLEFGRDRMNQEVSELKAINYMFYDKCVESEVGGRDDRLTNKEYSSLSKAYLLKNNTEDICTALSIPELKFLDIIRDNQRRKFAGYY